MERITEDARSEGREPSDATSRFPLWSVPQADGVEGAVYIESEITISKSEFEAEVQSNTPNFLFVKFLIQR